MTDLRLGLDLNCFTNRYTEPEEWTRIVNELGIKEVQFNADIIDPWLPWKIQKRLIRETLKFCEERDILISNSFGGHNHHQNFFGHPDADAARWYEGFYERMIRQTALLGAKGVGTCYAITTVKSAADPVKKKAILQRAAQSYIRLSRIAKKEGLEYLLFETTSVPRESCATLYTGKTTDTSTAELIWLLSRSGRLLQPGWKCYQRRQKTSTKNGKEFFITPCRFFEWAQQDLNL